MILSDLGIKEVIAEGEFAVETNGLELYIGPSSIDLHLDNKAKIDVPISEETPLGFKDYNGWEELVIYPGEFYILSTVEKIHMGRHIAGFVNGRSSLAREGLNIHLAGFVDPGFVGNITLEVTNFRNKPITLKKNLRICQLIIQPTDQPVQVSYPEKKDSKYQFQDGPTLRKQVYEN